MSRHFFAEIKARLPSLQIGTVFDVGANVGQTAKAVSTAFPSATVYSFEPVSSTFDELQKNTSSMSNVRCFNMALGARDGSATMTAKPLSTSNSIAATPPGELAEGTETVPVMTGARFCKREGIKQISILKIDTEGHDLDVVSGFIGLIQQHRINFVQVEASMNPYNKKHIAFRDFCGVLEPLGYVLFGIYDQVAEFKNRPFLRRSNPVFISDRISRAAPDK